MLSLQRAVADPAVADLSQMAHEAAIAVHPTAVMIVLLTKKVAQVDVKAVAVLLEMIVQQMVALKKNVLPIKKKVATPEKSALLEKTVRLAVMTMATALQTPAVIVLLDRMQHHEVIVLLDQTQRRAEIVHFDRMRHEGAAATDKAHRAVTVPLDPMQHRAATDRFDPMQHRVAARLIVQTNENRHRAILLK